MEARGWRLEAGGRRLKGVGGVAIMQRKLLLLVSLPTPGWCQLADRQLADRLLHFIPNGASGRGGAPSVPVPQLRSELHPDFVNGGGWAGGP